MKNYGLILTLFNTINVRGVPLVETNDACAWRVSGYKEARLGTRLIRKVSRGLGWGLGNLGAGSAGVCFKFRDSMSQK